MSESQALTLGETPDVFVQDFDRVQGATSLVGLTERQYREASFLDQRLIKPGMPVRVAHWSEIETFGRSLVGVPTPSYIFHLGHVGSTLISRILGDHPHLLSLREPPWLRRTAEAVVFNPSASVLPGLSAWQTIEILAPTAARVFRPGQRAVIKASSFASELAPLLQAAAPTARAIVLVAAPQVHMATLFAGENNMREVDVMGPSRLARLTRRAPEISLRFQDLSPGVKVAVTWLSEMASSVAALRLFGSGGLAVDFDRFLVNPRGAIAAIFDRLQIEVSTNQLSALAASPHFGRYSKSQAHEYSPQLRQELLRHAWTQNAAEIRKGLDWISETLARAPGLSATLGPFWKG
jgi:hypothetical protein